MILFNENYSAFDFKQYSNIVMWGAGVALRNFYELIKDEYDFKSVKCIIDNNEEKIGKDYLIGDMKIPIVSPDSIYRYDKDTLLIITTVKYKEILDQIQSYEGVRIKECCHMYDVYENTETILDAHRYYPQTYKKSNFQLIPKKIHYCWFGNNSLPDSVDRCITSWKKYCPDYEIIRWDEGNYDISFNKYMRQAYDNNKWAFVSDVARLDIIYKYGGIYLDTDVELIGSLDDLLFQNNYFGIEYKKYVSNGLGFGAMPKDQIIYDLLSLYDTRLFCLENGSFDMTPCPMIQKEIFAKYGYPFDGNYYSSDLLTVLPSRVLCAKSYFTGKLYCNEHTISIHHYDASWK